MKNKIVFVLIISLLTSLIACTSNKNTIDEKHNSSHMQTKEKGYKHNEEDKFSVNDIKNKYKSVSPKEWGDKVNGVITKIDTTDKIIALTFDACGGKGGSKYDEKIINYLIQENIPATLFINYRWIDENLDTFKMLSKNTLFEIENHGYEHRPLSVNGKSVYGINGTKSIDNVINEVYTNQKRIEELTGRKPMYFRSGTAFYDDISVNIVRDLGEKPVNFDIIGDAGATFSVNQIKEASLKAKSGSIIIYHMNQPEKSTAEGIMEVIPLLKEKGYKFVKLEDYDKMLK